MNSAESARVQTLGLLGGPVTSLKGAKLLKPLRLKTASKWKGLYGGFFF